MSDLEQTIKVSVEKVVDFYGDKVPAAQDAAGKIYVPLRQLSDNLGINFSGQRQRVLRDPVIATKIKQVEMQVADGRRLALMCLPLEMIPGWLFGITSGKMRPELQEKLNRYRSECFEVLWNAFKQDILPANTPPGTGLSAAQQTLEMIRAMEHLALQQVEIEGRVTGIEGRQETLEGYMRGFIQDTRSRLTALELRLDPGAVITEEQAAALVIAVKTIAYELEERGKVGTYQSGYARVYSELYRRYDVKTYKNLRRDRYDQAMNWLREWYDEVTGKAEAEGGAGE